jgi:hypothetical protein
MDNQSTPAAHLPQRPPWPEPGSSKKADLGADGSGGLVLSVMTTCRAAAPAPAFDPGSSTV